MLLRFTIGLLTITTLCIATAPATADVRLPHVLADHMVMQQKMDNPFWGWAEPGEEVSVTIGETKAQTTADDQGKWLVKIAAPPAGGPYEVHIAGKNTITLTDVLCGEVWLCSGQSNMERTLASVPKSHLEIAVANHPSIRLFHVPHRVAQNPLDDCEANWVACSPETAPSFTAIGYFYGVALHKQLGVPIGLVQSTWGGTPAEAWMRMEALKTDPDFEPIVQRTAKFFPQSPKQGTNLYDGMIHCLVPLAIRGVIWYQGESNVDRAQQYAKLFPALITDWRKIWGQGDFPFLYVQLAPFRYRAFETSACAELWEAQSKAMSLPNTGMVVTTDIGNNKDIHPHNKPEVARRLALWALGDVYGKKVVYRSPMYESMSVMGNAIQVKFQKEGGVLVTNNGERPSHFMIAGEDREFFPALAVVKGMNVVVQSPHVKKPVAVRFAWDDTARPNLFNRAGLPASPFRTDDWEMVTSGKK